LKIRHSAIVDNVVTYVYAKFDDDRLWNEKALADHKSDNNKHQEQREQRWRPLGTCSRVQKCGRIPESYTVYRSRLLCVL